MTTLEDLARVLGGTIKVWDDQRWLDTTIGDLRAAIIEQQRPLTLSTIFDLAVLTPSALDFEPLDTYMLDGSTSYGYVPRLQHGYVFAGWRGGVLFATTSSEPILEHIIATLWSLAAIAREPPATTYEATTFRTEPSRFPRVRALLWRVRLSFSRLHRFRAVLWRVAFVLAVLLLLRAVRGCA